MMMKVKEPTGEQIQQWATYLKLPFCLENYEVFALQAAKESVDHIQYLAKLFEGEVNCKQDRATQRRLRQARLPVIKTLDQFQWDWPKKINQLQVKHLFRLHWADEHSNIIFLGGVGLGKTHLSIALAYRACLAGYQVLFTTAVDLINSLNAAQKLGRLKIEIRKYLRPMVLVIDELGYLPFDKNGVSWLFQVISQRYEQGSTIITTNKSYKLWPEIFNNDATVTSAVLDRLLHHAETVVIEGPSFRMKDIKDN
jgi:DNA replication protein DnaC|tara:strand:- start:235 stop:996 length:762 start_codon:yes stop_codon:yes gene_type:complete